LQDWWNTSFQISFNPGTGMLHPSARLFRRAPHLLGQDAIALLRTDPFVSHWKCFHRHFDPNLKVSPVGQMKVVSGQAACAVAVDKTLAEMRKIVSNFMRLVRWSL
jgi:hypothetical protein